MTQLKICMDCKIAHPIDQYQRNGQVSRYNPTLRYKPRCRACNQKYQEAIYYDKLIRAIHPKPLRCERCGYDTCHNALEFHHVDPNDKERAISMMTNYSYSKIKSEVDKCIILCANCHREVHAGVWSI